MPRGAWHHTVVDTDGHTILWQMQFFHKLAQRAGRRFNRFVIDVHYHNAFILGHANTEANAPPLNNQGSQIKR